MYSKENTSVLSWQRTKGDTVMETNEIIKQYNILPEYAQKRVRNLINELFTANEESQNYCIHT